MNAVRGHEGNAIADTTIFDLELVCIQCAWAHVSGLGGCWWNTLLRLASELVMIRLSTCDTSGSRRRRIPCPVIAAPLNRNALSPQEFEAVARTAVKKAKAAAK